MLIFYTLLHNKASLLLKYVGWGTLMKDVCICDSGVFFITFVAFQSVLLFYLYSARGKNKKNIEKWQSFFNCLVLVNSYCCGCRFIVVLGINTRWHCYTQCDTACTQQYSIHLHVCSHIVPSWSNNTSPLDCGILLVL